MTAPARFKEIDLTRAMRAAKACGYAHVRVTVEPAGNMVIDAFEAAPNDVTVSRPSPLDRFRTRP